MKIFYSLCLAAIAAGAVNAAPQNELQLVDQTLANPDNEPAPVHPVPHDRQVKWMETEFYAFFHYGMNTFTDKEWGNGDEDTKLYAPLSKPNPRQWLEAVKEAGMKGGIAVVKHHDGFCLWPTETTDHSIINAGNENGKTNIAEEFAQAARDLDMKYGFYVSPWDRNSAYYGDGTNNYVEKVFKKQCDELTSYGTDQFEMWFDGANGGGGYYGGANENRTIDASTYYDIPNLRDWVHKKMPDCVMWGVGDEARWIGNEAGWAGETCWSYGDGVNGDPNAWYWKHGESDAKATNRGWFWHSGESPHSANRVWQFYMETIGRNATLILNYPPNNHGILPEADVKVLKEFGEMLRQRLGTDLAPMATAEASVTRTNGASRTYDASNLIDGDKETYWAAPDGVTDATITLTFDEPKNVHLIALQEYMRLGQRIKEFEVETSTDGFTWVPFTGMQTTTVGYKRILALSGSTSNYGDGQDLKAIRIHIRDAKACPTLHTISIY
ncbi:MAG: alpha-L-fucosidase [Muribaculaceae bacterium]|nr:alpha-L-fucosidase [Muribaculaceae bacterium]